MKSHMQQRMKLIRHNVLLFKNEGEKTGFEVINYTLSLENKVLVTPDGMLGLGNVRPCCCHGVNCNQ